MGAERTRRIMERTVRLAEVRAEAARYARMLGICADGTPVRRLDEVWTVDGDGPYHVDCNWADGTASLVEVAGHVECRTLTHERPGSAPAEPPEAVPVDAGGAPIRVGDAVRSTTGVELTVTAVEEASARPGDWVVTGRTGHGTTSFFASSLTRKRPAPKVLDADGVEIELGDDLYSVEGGLKLHVGHIDRFAGKIATADMFAIDRWADPSLYTHRAPVLASDGRPLREGETVWTKDGFGWTVADTDVAFMPGCVQVRGSGKMSYANPLQLTHERPDSWERLEDDATLPVVAYCERMGIEVEEGSSFVEPFARDLVRRAKALAGRGK